MSITGIYMYNVLVDKIIVIHHVFKIKLTLYTRVNVSAIFKYTHN